MGGKASLSHHNVIDHSGPVCRNGDKLPSLREQLMVKEILSEFEETNLGNRIVKGVQRKRQTLSEIYEPDDGQPTDKEEQADHCEADENV